MTSTRMSDSTDAATAESGDTRTTKTFKWVEPPLRPPAPSFMEYPHLALVRHGVLENMAPLGTLPSSKLKKSTKTEGPRRVTLAKKGEPSVSAASTPRAATPEPTVNPSRRRSESHAMVDAEWNPTTPVTQTSTRKSTVRESVGRQSLPPQASSMSASVSPSKYKFQSDAERDAERLNKAVDIACEAARATSHIHTAYALRTLYDDHICNPRIVRQIEQVAMGEATEADLREFKKMMQYKKTEGRTSGKSKQLFAQNNKVSPVPPIHFAPVNFSSSPKKTVPETTHDPASRSPHREAGGHVHKKHKGNSYERKNNSALEVNGIASMKNGSHSRTRSNSAISSDSELSSLDEELLGGDRDSFGDSAEGPSQATASHAVIAASPADSHAHARNNQTQPMTHQKTLGPKLHAWDTNPNSIAARLAAPSSNTNSKSPASASFANHSNTNMPSRLFDLSPSQPPQQHSQQPQQPSSLLLQHPTLKSFKKATSGAARDSDDSDRTLRLKRKARDITENNARIYDSFDRHQVEPREPESELEGGVASQPIKSGQVLRFRSIQANKRVNDESDDLSSPTLLSFQPDVAPGSSSNSRAGTPGTLSRPLRKPKSGLRMKTSPMKKKAGPSAGIPRASGERNSPVGNGAFPHNQDDNDDYCSSCGGNGELVCCDGCTRSFHFRCVDPPLSENQLPDNWFCNACNAVRNPKSGIESSLFGILLAILQKKNPSAFHLPKDVREYFEGVRTGTEGEYEDGVVQKPKRNAGYEEVPDYLKLKDAKGSFILCHECRQGAGSGNPIIPCSYCGLHWHLDCLDPPLANPPPLGKPWRCPCHVDDLLAMVPGSLGPAHRFRKIKGASMVRPAFPRGFKNDGHVEIELAPSDEEDEGFFDQKEYGKIYKLPEEGIKLDFISRVRGKVGQVSIPTPPPEIDESAGKQRFTSADRHSLLEQQAALNFAQLAIQEAAPDGAKALVDALIAEAPPSVIAMMAQGDATNIASNKLCQRDKQALLAMKALIEKMLTEAGEDAADLVKVEGMKGETEGDDVDMLH